MARPQTVFKGTQQEADDLNAAITRWCTCVFDEAGALTSACPPHLMMVNDQRALDGLLFMRRCEQKLMQGEWHVD